MPFPAWLELGPVRLHPHMLFELAGYAVGFRLFLAARVRAGDHLGERTRWWVIAAAICGAAAGSKLVFLALDPALTAANWADPAYTLGGKTIVGGLAGGLLGVELAKKALGVARSTGDLFALPLAAGIAIGRIGCFLTGLADHTHGVATTLPWGVDFGDGIARHPTQLYEITFLLALVAVLIWLKRRPTPEGVRFQVFMGGYMAFRLLVDFIKPGIALAGLTAIQWTCAAVLVHYAWAAAHAPRPEASHG